MKQKTILVGIAGASASGKSLLAETLIDELQSEQVCVISEDSYYKDQTEMSMEERILTNYDHPDSMDHNLLLAHMNALKNGDAVNVPTYDYSRHIVHRKHTALNPLGWSLLKAFYSFQILNYAIHLIYAFLWTPL